jgi:isocitrate dehydrogenase
MQSVFGLMMAAIAIVSHRETQQFVRKALDTSINLHSLMITMAGDTILLDQILVK